MEKGELEYQGQRPRDTKGRGIQRYEELQQIDGETRGSVVELHSRQRVSLSVLVPPPPDRLHGQLDFPHGNLASFLHQQPRIAFYSNLLSLSNPRSERP